MMNFISLLDQQARTRPEKLALRADGQDWSYAALAQAGRQAATVLYEQGVRQGDKLGLLCFNTPGFVFALLGAWRLGAVVVPINHKLQAPEVSYILRHSGARLCLVDGARADHRHPGRTTATGRHAVAEHSFCHRRPGLLR